LRNKYYGILNAMVSEKLAEDIVSTLEVRESNEEISSELKQQILKVRESHEGGP